MCAGSRGGPLPMGQQMDGVSLRDGHDQTEHGGLIRVHAGERESLAAACIDVETTVRESLAIVAEGAG